MCERNLIHSAREIIAQPAWMSIFIWFGSAYGWQHDRGSGDIEIAVLFLCRLDAAILGIELVGGKLFNLEWFLNMQ